MIANRATWLSLHLTMEAGFVSVVRRGERFFQPLLVAVNAPAP